MKKKYGVSVSSVVKGEIHHSPSWYRKRCDNEWMPTPMLKQALEVDCGDWWDQTETDDENITRYEEMWNTPAFIKNNYERVAELFFIEMKTDDRPTYQRYMKDISDDEIYYDNTIDKIARALMNGNQQPFFIMMRKIRRDSQRGGKYNKIGKGRASMKTAIGFGEMIKEDKTVFGYKEEGGCDTDYQKEINHLGVSISFLEGIQEKMKHIAAEEIKVVGMEMERLTERLEYMFDKTTNTIQSGWVNSETLMSVLSQHGYKKNGARLSDGAKQSIDKDEKKMTARFEELMQRGNTDKLDYSGFE